MDMPVEKKIGFELNGRSVEALEGETILEAADRIGIEIPRLCYKEGIPVSYTHLRAHETP